MVNDPISNMLSQLKNAASVGKTQVVIPFSQLKLAILKILVDQNYLKNVTKRQRKNRAYLYVDLEFANDRPKITEIERISKPSRRIYVRADDIRPIRGGTGMAIVSTSAGIMVASEAKKQKLGGELLCQVW